MHITIEKRRMNQVMSQRENKKKGLMNRTRTDKAGATHLHLNSFPVCSC